MNLDDAKAALAQLQTVQADNAQTMAALQADLDALKAGAGDALLDAALQSDGDAQDRLLADLDGLQARLDAQKALAGALDRRLERAKMDVKLAKAPVLLERAATIDGDIKARLAKRAALIGELEALEGRGAVMLSPGCKTEQMRQHAERLRGAAAMLQAGRDAGIDPATGRALDAGL